VRVLHVDPERGWGGGEVQVTLLLAALRRRGVGCTLAADPRGRLAAQVAATGDAPVVPLSVRNHLDLPAGLRLRRLVRGHDVVHFHTARAHALAPLVARRGLRRIVTRRMDYVPAGGPYARWLYNRAVDRVIAISEGVRAALLAAGVRGDRIRVVPSGVDPERLVAPPGAGPSLRRAWEVRDDELLVVAPGVLERRKGHAVLLDALARVPGPVRLVVCGDGAERAALAAAARPLGTRVRFAGFRDDMPACLAAADMVAMPSLQEGLGVAALEAMAAGRAVVASRTGGLAEVVVEGETGFLVPPGDAGALAVALARLAADAALRARLGAAGRARVLAHYTSARMAEGTLSCYEDRP
jgi:glycosyltransferase involved in cell wall biosynthesis